ncbi:transglutaminase-like enzyme, predicted cysteine protease [Xenococcus sp. PCC 7305]|uniref:transglutaminase-like domain-containing protein n=1 Tax=Xenococcus sp. PCC 7305 TaxID=102125 RepID=UPI0002AC7624|nr:transglutaminase family protein [Xenococcus sp. PCC 7305]ELS05205.1 transglutaminase-like enzyme, predicted cysteine protease [Xenococcus sp. PCC 7305]
MQKYLQATDIIDWQNPEILQLAQFLSQGKANIEATVQACFEWVRDEIYHSSDHKMNPLTCRASEVLQYKTGYCYAKSHLLAALLRANSIPAGFCYQRLSVNDDGAPYCLHGLNAVYLPSDGWYRLDPRGNKIGVDAQFIPPQEKLAFRIKFPEEVDCQHIFSEPLPEIIQALQTHTTWQDLLNNLPDLQPRFFQSLNH